jgi:short-subunit dehydrogenase
MKKALITGASSGIGEALAVQLANRGCDLILAGRDQARLAQLATRLRQQVKVQVVDGDLSQASDCERLIRVIHSEVPDLVINNAGFGLYGDVLSYPTEQQLNIVEVNVLALLELTIEAGRALVSAGKEGIIMNVSSVAATPVMPLFSVYSASKAFVNQLSESLDFEWRPHRIRVLTACPGMVNTRFHRRATNDPSRKVSSVAEPMTAEFAASEILAQIDAGRRLHAFGMRYRITNFLCRYILPKALVAAAVSADLRKRAGDRPLILLSNNERS